jgi:hypothetical protein
MDNVEDEYQALRRLGPDARGEWVRAHAPAELRGHWWLALVETAEFNASPRRDLPPDLARENMAFAVEVIEMAERDGMPPSYAASRLGRLALAALTAGERPSDLPPAISPDQLCRRILGTFRLDRDQAVKVAERLSEQPADAPATPESDALRDIRWLLADLQSFEPHLSDPVLAAEVRGWLDISSRL